MTFTKILTFATLLFIALPVSCSAHSCTRVTLLLPLCRLWTVMFLFLPLAERVRKLPCGNGLLREDRQGDRQPCGSSECCHGGGTCVEGETQTSKELYRWHYLFCSNINTEQTFGCKCWFFNYFELTKVVCLFIKLSWLWGSYKKIWKVLDFIN